MILTDEDGFWREKRYRLVDIRQLSAGLDEDSANLDKLVSPLKDFGKAGVVNFYYRGTKVGLAAGLDEAHGEQVVEWIARRTPRSVMES